MTFDVETELTATVDQNSLRSARSTIEDEIQDVAVGVDADNSGLPGGGAVTDGGIAAAGGTAILDEIEEQTEAIIDLQDTVEQSAVSAGGGAGGGGGVLGSILPGGGGGSGGLFAGVTLGTLLGGGKTKLVNLISKVPFRSLLSKVPSLVALIGTADLAGDLIDGGLGPDDLVDTTIKMGNLVTGGLAPNDFVAGAVGAGVGGYGILQIGSLVTGTLSGTALSGYLGSTAMGTLVNPFTGSLVTLLGGTIALHDLVDGDISKWNLPAKFGDALGQGFEKEWPGMADKIRSAFTDNPAYDAGKATADVADKSSVSGENRQLSPGLDTGFIDPREIPILSDAYNAGQQVGDTLRGDGNRARDRRSQPIQLDIAQQIDINDSRELDRRLESLKEDLKREINRELGTDATL